MEPSEAGLSSPPSRRQDPSRLVALTDGVVAIAITLLVLEIGVPQVPERLVADELGSALLDLRPEIFGFVLSFLIIGYYWLGHRLIFSHLTKVDSVLTAMNMFFLLVIAFVPFVAGLFADYAPDSLAVAIYCGVACLAGLSLLLMVAYPRRKGHFHPNVSLTNIDVIRRSMMVAPIVYLVAIPVAFIDGWLAVGLFLVIPIARLVIYRRLET